MVKQAECKARAKALVKMAYTDMENKGIVKLDKKGKSHDSVVRKYIQRYLTSGLGAGSKPRAKRILTEAEKERNRMLAKMRREEKKAGVYVSRRRRADPNRPKRESPYAELKRLRGMLGGGGGPMDMERGFNKRPRDY
jgi:hypothetical protein